MASTVANDANLAKAAKQNHAMGWVRGFVTSSIGAKYVMAASGIALVGFVLIHMIGNLQVFLGWEKLNAYAAFLKSLGSLLWVARGGLLLAVLAHIASGLRLAYLNKQARPVPYRKQTSMHTNVFARTMAVSGLILLAFIVYHLLHFTLGVTNPADYSLEDPLGRHDVYSMVVRGFQQPLVSASYIVAMALVGMHLSHGATSMFQSLGLNHPKYNGMFSKVGPAIGVLVFLGNVSMPVAVLLGFIQPR